MKVQLPENLDKELKSLILRGYASAIRDVGPPEYQYVKEKLPNVCRRLQSIPDDWPAPIGHMAQVLFEALRPALHDSPRLSQTGSRLVLAALFYLCDPFDVIPDFTPGTGYYDDAVVLNECLRLLKHLNQRDYKIVIVALQGGDGDSI